jgi:phosphatidylinositol alpha-1,6-mannosyltransferase
MIANRGIRGLDVGRFGSPNVLVSPGINCMDADAIGVHMVFAKYWEQVREQMRKERRSLSTFPRALHRTLYVGLIRVLEHRVYKGPALLWCGSRADATVIEALFGRPTDSVFVVPLGVDPVAFDIADRRRRRAPARETLGMKDERLLLLVGNDLNKKGADLAIRALATLPPDVQLAIAGSAPEHEVRRLAFDAGVGDRVRILPHTDDPAAYYAAADLLVAPSREDSFHLPALEAMACGLPVVLSARAGAAELVKDGVEARIVRDPTDVRSLAEAVMGVLDSPELAEGLASRGRAFAERCSWDENARATADLIEREATTPRVLVLAPEARGVGGIQRATRMLVDALSASFGEDRIGTLSLRANGDEALRGRLLRAGAPGGDGRVSLFQKGAFLLQAVNTARRWRRRLGVVATHPHLAPVARACRAVSGAPYAVWCHGIESWTYPSYQVGAALRAADAVFAPSEFTARTVEVKAGLVPGSVRVVPHALPPVPLHEGEPESIASRPVVLTVARLTGENRYKGVDMLLYAWPRILNRIDTDLLVVGDGPDRPRLEAIVSLLSIGDRVRFTGRLSDVELGEAYGRATLFAMPARHRLEPTPEGEGFGLVYVEASANGLPVVAGRGAGAEDAVEDEVSGLLVDPEDAGAVADAIVRVLLDNELAARLGKGGRELAATRFAPDVFRERITKLVLDLEPRGLVT